MTAIDMACPLFTAVGADDRSFALSDYEGAAARWCPGCGDHSILTAVERLLVAEQLKPEQTVFVPGQPAMRGSYGADQLYPNSVHPAYRPYQARIEGYLIPKNDSRKFSVN